VTGRVLIVDDDVDMCEVLIAGLSARGLEVTYVTSAAEAVEELEKQDFATVVTDVCMRGTNGIDLCRQITERRPQLPVVVITAFGSLDTAVGAIRAGAYDFVTKPLDTEELARILSRAIQLRGLREEIKRLRCALDRAEQFSAVLGESPEMRKLCSLLARISDSEASVLITGETGSGKEVVARALHDSSRRSSAPFVAINCAAVPELLLESELFGHVKGAYTDARTPRKGLFLQADGGTLFLDEIGGLPLPLQPKLLRALQERRVRPVGGDTEVPFDVRLISATNRDLQSAVADGLFREDLYFRIDVLHLELPPLRARGNDVVLLAQHFIREFAASSKKEVVGLSTPVAQRLLAYPWPGNVRELRNCIEGAVALATCDHLMLEDLPAKVRDYSPSHVVIASQNPSELVTMEEVERRYVRRVMEAVNGNKTLAARILGLDRKTLYRKLEGYAVLEKVKSEAQGPG
jgi:two-component system response regulator HydG